MSHHGPSSMPAISPGLGPGLKGRSPFPSPAALPVLPLGWALILLLAAGCPAKVVHRCPTPRRCSIHPERRRPRVTPPRHSTALAGFSFVAPRRYALPTSIRRPRSVAISPDGELVAVGGRWGRLQVLRSRGGRALFTLGHADELVRGLLVRFSPSGKMLASARHKLTTVRLWSTRTGRLLRELRARGYPIRDMALGASQRVIMATGAGVEIWNGGTGRHERLLKMRFDLPVTRVASSRSGLCLAGDRAGNVMLFSAVDGSRLGRMETPGKRLAALGLSPDGARAVLAYRNGMVRMATTSPFRRVRGFSFRTRGSPVRVTFTAQGRAVVVADSAGRIEHIRATDAKLLSRNQLRGKRLDDVTLSADGRLLAAASEREGVELWQARRDPVPLGLPARYIPPPTARPRPAMRLVRPVRLSLETPHRDIAAFALGKRGKLLAVAELPARVGVYYLVTRPRRGGHPYAKLLYSRSPRKAAGPRRLRQEPIRVAITPDRRWLLAQGGGFYLSRWALVSGRRIRSFFSEKPPLRSLLPFHDNRKVATIGPGRKIQVWSIYGRRLFGFSGIRDPYWIGVTRRGKTLVEIQGWDRMVAFDVPSGKRRWDNPSGPLADFEVVAMRFSRDSQQLITFHKTGFLRFYDVATGAVHRRIRIPLPSKPTRCDMRPDAKVMACAVPEGVALLELPSGALIRTLPLTRRLGAVNKIRAISYSPRGNTLVVQTGRRSLAVFNFDHPGKAIRYTGIDAWVRVRLGLPAVAPKVRVKPGAIPGRRILEPTGPLRRPHPRKP